MLPLKDLNRTLTKPHINRLLLITNITIFAAYWLSTQNILLDNGFATFVGSNFVLVPSEILQGQRIYTFLTSMFMHASWYHLIGNMLYLFIFGDNVEDIFGHAGYLFFYLFSGLVASLVHIGATLYAPVIGSLIGVTIPSDMAIGLIGASGAISAVLGAYVILFPKALILTIVFFIILPVPAIFFLGFWFVMQWLLGIFDASGGIAYFAHIGGFVAGMILALTIGLKRRKILKAIAEAKKR